MSWLENGLSGWIPTVGVFLLGGILGRNKIKDRLICLKKRIHNSEPSVNVFLPSSINPIPTQTNNINGVVNALIDDNVSLLLFNQILYGKENDVLDNLNYVVQQYLQKKKSYNGLLSNIAKCNVLNEKLDAMIKSISMQNGKKFDEMFVKLYTAANWKDFLDEKFVEFASPCYGNSWNDESVLSKIIENVLSELRSTGDYNVENNCSRVLQILWNSLNSDFKYEIAIAYYDIYDDNVYRQKKFLQKQFAAKIYEELGLENIVKEMIKPDLKSSSANIEAIAKKYRLKKEWIKEQYDEQHQKINLDLDDFART